MASNHHSFHNSRFAYAKTVVKTEGLWLGRWKSRLGKDDPFGILWPKEYVTALGITFPYNANVGIKFNFEEKLAKLKKVLNIWCKRHLTILGRIAIEKFSNRQTCLLLLRLKCSSRIH